MQTQPHPALVFLLAVFSGWVNRHQQRVIEFLVEENRILRRKFGKRRIRFTDNERRRLARLGKMLGRKLLTKVATIVTPDTILAWHRRLYPAYRIIPRRRRDVCEADVSRAICATTRSPTRDNQRAFRKARS